jgi:hypothetical protein
MITPVANIDLINEDKNTLLILIHSSETFFAQLIRELTSFSWTESNSIHVFHLDRTVENSEVTKHCVSLLERKIRFIFLSTALTIVEPIIQGVRYLNQPCIFNSISDSAENINIFYNISKIIPKYDVSKKVSCLLRTDYTAVQLHLLRKDTLTAIENTQNRVLRLGQLKENIYNAESHLRDADITHINHSALKHSESPAQYRVSQSGLTSEELCQLARYIGINDKMQLTIIDGICENHPSIEISINVISQALWYLADGYFSKKSDYPSEHNQYIEYHVTMDEYDQALEFIKSERSGRWWLKCPYAEVSKRLPRHHWHAVNYEDYQLVAQGEISDNIAQALVYFEILKTWNTQN